MVERKIPANKIDVIPNGCNTELFYPQDPDKKLQKDLGIEKKLVIGYIGTHGLAHGLEFIIRAFQKLDATKTALLLIGDAAEKAPC